MDEVAVKKRVFKFRAWDSFTKHMWMWEDMQTFNGDDHLKLYFEDSDNNVMQFTGIKDKNNKDIYEGDILNIWHSHEHDSHIAGEGIVVVWRDVSAGFALRDHEQESDYPMDVDLSTDGDKPVFEVIGNVYENEELINGR